MTGRRVAVVGLGLIGASLAGALRRGGDFVCGCDVDPAVARVAASRGLVDRALTDLGEAVHGADLVVLAIPVLSITRLISQVESLCPRDAVIMDVGSVKAPVIEAMQKLAAPSRAIGGHPIAGKEAAGPEAADPNLFRGCTFVLVPGTDTAESTVEYAQAVALDLGANPVLLEALEHDRVLARTSHLPQMVSIALGLSLEGGDAVFAGPALRDMTRLTASPPAIWQDILLANRANIISAMSRCMDHLGELAEIAGRGDTEGLESAMRRAQSLAPHGAGEILP